jgi:RNA polymerase sigma factor (sigma-70 family)
MPPQDPEQARWFAAELRPHEAMLRAWLQSQFAGSVDVDDVLQESYVRVLEAHGQAFLFATARNLALMRLRHLKVERRDSITEAAFAGILDEGVDVPSAVERAQDLELLTQAIQSLPTRCRQIITLRKIYGLSQKQVAAELGISEHTVEAQGTIGLRKLGEFFARHGNTSPRG